MCWPTVPPHPLTVAHHGTLLGPESTYMKEAPKSAGIVCKIAVIEPFYPILFEKHSPSSNIG